MEELKSQIKQLTFRQRIEMIAIVVVGISVIISIIFMYKSLTRTEVTQAGVQSLQEQNAQLQKNNEQLIKTVESLGNTIASRTARDSVKWQQVEANNRLIPGINKRLNSIDDEYNETIINARSYDVNEVTSYISNEAERLRKGVQ